MARRKLPDLTEARRIGIETEVRSEKRKSDLALRTLGLTLKQALAAGFTTRELAEILDVSPSSISRWARL